MVGRAILAAAWDRASSGESAQCQPSTGRTHHRLDPRPLAGGFGHQRQRLPYFAKSTTSPGWLRAATGSIDFEGIT